MMFSSDVERIPFIINLDVDEIHHKDEILHIDEAQYLDAIHHLVDFAFMSLIK